MTSPTETFISVDIESAGPYPGRYSLLSIGACLVENPEEGFYVELKPVNQEVVESSLHASHLSVESLAKTGEEPLMAMRMFTDWIRQVADAGHKALLVGFNVPYVWSFINHYFLHYLSENPFGHSAIDIRAFYMGLIGCAWEETSMLYLSSMFPKTQGLPHDALADARLQANLFGKLLAQSRGEVVAGK